MKVFRVKTTVSILEKDSIELWEPATTKTSLAPFSIFINLFPFYYSPSCGSWNVWPESHWPSFQTCHGLRSNLCQLYVITRVPWMKWGILLKPCHYDIVGRSMTLHTKGRFDDGTRLASCHQKQQFSRFVLSFYSKTPKHTQFHIFPSPETQRM